MKRYFLMLSGRLEGDERALDAVGKMKQFATYFTHGIRNGTKLRVSIYNAREPQEIVDHVDAFFEELLEQPAAA